MPANTRTMKLWLVFPYSFITASMVQDREESLAEEIFRFFTWNFVSDAAPMTYTDEQIKQQVLDDDYEVLSTIHEAAAVAKQCRMWMGDAKLRGSNDDTNRVEFQASALMGVDVTFDEQTHLFTIIDVKQMITISEHKSLQRRIQIALDDIPSEQRQFSVADFCEDSQQNNSDPQTLMSRQRFELFYNFLSENGFYQGQDKETLYRQLLQEFMPELDADFDPVDIQSGMRCC